jgi:hypothetical protein
MAYKRRKRLGSGKHKKGADRLTPMRLRAQVKRRLEKIINQGEQPPCPI